MRLSFPRQHTSAQSQPAKPSYVRLHNKQENIKASEVHTRAPHPPLRAECLEAVDVLRTWRNSLFAIMLLCLLLLQTSFWLVRTADIETGPGPNADTPASVRVLAKLGYFSFEMPFECIAAAVRTGNAILVFASIFYSLIMLFGLTVSLGNRLGGLKHICRAFYFSLGMLILLMPWQTAAGTIALGAMYTPEELLISCTGDAGGMFGTALLYLRFSGYWIIVVALLGMTQLLSIRWTKAHLRGPEQASYAFWHQVVLESPEILSE